MFNKDSQSYEMKADIIIYATPLSVTLRWFDKIPEPVKLASEKLFARHSIMVFLFIDIPSLYDGWTIEFYDQALVFFRIAQQNVLSSTVAPSGKTLLSVEISATENDQIWIADELSLVERIRQDLEKVNILKEESIDGYKIIKIRNAYPVVRADRDSDRIAVIEFVNSFKNEYTIGTLGANPDALVSTRHETDDSEIKAGTVGVAASLSNSSILFKKIISDWS